MELTQFDNLLSTNGPVALVIKEYLIPVAGKDSPIFPPTFAPPEGSPKGTPGAPIIDEVRAQDGSRINIALIDTIGAQANRIEPLFSTPPYNSLVPKIEIVLRDRTYDLLNVGHRSADALIRYSSEATRFQNAFEEYKRVQNAMPLAKINPTGILFGLWDSRGTQVKLPRLVSSSIRGFDVSKLQRAGQYFSKLEPIEAEEVESSKDERATDGLVDNPVKLSPGGVLVRGDIVREAVLNLIPLRSLSGANPEDTLKLQRYILALSLIAFLAPAEYFLRQGCLLTSDPDRPAEPHSVTRQGKREPFSFDEANALEFALLAAGAFGVGESFTAQFTPEAAREAKKASDATKAAKKAKK